MKLRGRHFLLLITLVVLPAVAQADSGFGRFHALVIGNQNYRHLNKLQTPLADAKAVAEVLQTQYDFTVDLLLDKSRDEIKLALSELRKTMTDERDSLLIYYAGHGYLDNVTGTGYWQPVDAEKDNDVYWLPTDEISRLLKAIRARHVLIVADSCYSGSLLMRDSGARLPAAASRDEWLKRMQAKRSRTALTSGGEEPVADGGGSGHSVFAKVLLEALRENKEILDGDSLFDRIKRPVILNAEQTPLYGDIKMTDHEMGDFLLVPKALQEGGIQEKPESKADLDFLKRDSPTKIVSYPVEELRHENRDIAVTVMNSSKTPQQGDTLTDSITGMELIYIPKGCFQMGSSENEEGRDEDEGPVHKVCVDGFWMGKYEVTQGQWQKIMFSNPAKFQNGDDYPVEQISFDDVQDFIKRLNSRTGLRYHLPTEAEWEYACRANGSDRYCGGDDVEAVAWYGNNSEGSTHPVGKKQKNAFGLYDMSGNVWEWCADLYGKNYYVSMIDTEKNPLGPSYGSTRVIRGGNWYGTLWEVRATNRKGDSPDFRYDGFGFRIALPVR